MIEIYLPTLDIGKREDPVRMNIVNNYFILQI